MRFFKALPLLTVIAIASPASANEQIEAITKGVTAICDVPENAGSFWNANVGADGSAKVNIKLAKLGVTGDADFQAGEWKGVVDTLENSKNYRDCVKSILPIFLEKFSGNLAQPKEAPEKKPRTVGGISWVRYDNGVKIKLKECERKGSSLQCNFAVTSEDRDARFGFNITSKIYDQRGYEFVGEHVGIAKKTGSNVLTDLVQGVETAAFIRFKGVDEESQVITLARISLASSKVIEFRNIGIEIK